MAFINVTDTVLEDAALQTDYDAAEALYKVRLGAQCVYFPKRLKSAYIPFSELSRAFLRIETTISRVCCGKAEFRTYRLILCGDGRELAAVELDSEEKGKRILAALHARGVPIGKPATREPDAACGA